MKVSSLASAATWVLMLASLCAAQLPGDDPQGAALLDAAVESHGGAEAILSLSDSRTRGLLIKPAEGLFSIQILSRGFDRLRIESEGRGIRKTYVNDGRFAWSVEGQRRRSLGESRAANQINPYNPALGILRAYLMGRLQSEYLGQERIGNASYHRLAVGLSDPDSVRLQQGRPIERSFEILIQEGTFLITELALVSQDWDRESPELWNRWSYSDFRWTENLAVPWRIVQFSGGTPVAEITVEQFQAVPLGAVFQEPEN